MDDGLRKPWIVWWGAAMVVVLSGCTRSTAPEDHSDAPLETDRLVYDLREDDSGNLRTEIPFTYRNTTGETVYLVNCRGSVPPSLEKRTGDDWTVAWSPVVLRCLSPPITVGSGELYEDTLFVFAAPRGSNAGPQFEVAEPQGTYRLVWHVPLHDYDFDNPPSGSPLPLEGRISNLFELRAP